MLTIRIQLSEDRMGLEAHGHAGYGVLGQDIVCAAASTLVNTFLLALHSQTGPDTDVRFEESDAGSFVIEARASPADRKALMAISRTIGCGLEALAYKYPDNVDFELIEY